MEKIFDKLEESMYKESTTISFAEVLLIVVSIIGAVVLAIHQIGS